MAARTIMTAAAVGLVLVGAGGAYAAASSDGSDITDTEAGTIRAVVAEQRDLVEHTNLDGTFGYARTRSVAAPVAGTITAVVDDGEPVGRGDTIYEIDATPVVALYGEVPLYRPLAEGDEGDDVELLEANLASLGYHIEEPEDGEDEVDSGFTVDGVFDAATTAAVRRWQADLGRDETGTVAVGDAVVVPGPATASGIGVEVGSAVQPGSPILDLAITAQVGAFHSPEAGELDLVASSSPVTSGQVLYTVDGRPVTAMVSDPASDTTFDRDLAEGIDDGPDVLALEEMLVALGFDARGDLVVDDEFDDLTTEAVEDWEDDLQDRFDLDDEEFAVDGIVSLDQIVVVAQGSSVESVTERDGDTVATGSELFTWAVSSGSRVVSTAIDVADQDRLAEGSAVDIEFPDGSIVTGTVSKVATSSSTDPATQEAEPTLAVEIALPEVPEAIAGLNELDVEVKLVESLVAGATVVPASALVATADGGYAVEVVAADGTIAGLVAVEPGMFADGYVEVTGIDPGTAVVVPS